MSAIDICPDCGHKAAEHGNAIGCMVLIGSVYCDCARAIDEVEQMVELATMRRLLLECWSLTRDDATASDELREMIERLKAQP